MSGKAQGYTACRKPVLFLAVLALVAVMARSSGAAKTAPSKPAVALLTTPASTDWSAADGDIAGSRYSSLTQIDTSNVGKLKVAWTKAVDTPEMLGPNGAFSGIESIPLEAGGTLFVPTPVGVQAIDAVTGKAKWTFSGTAALSEPCFGTFCLGSSANAARDISLGDGMVFVGQQDGSIIAVN
jgi:glucose dehydrogenase